MNQNDEYLSNNNTTSINVDYSTNKLPLWAKKSLKINYDDDLKSSNNNLVHRPNSNGTISSSTPTSASSNRTRINLYNNRSTDSDGERNSVDDNQANEFETPIERLKKKAQLLSSIKSEKLNGGDHLDASDDLTSLNKKKNPLYVSTENLKFNDNFFTKTPLPKSTNSTTLQLNNKPSPAQKPSTLLNNNNNSPSLNSTNSLNNSLNNSATLKSNSINRPAVSKRREELAKALSGKLNN